ncbi:MAG: hypothetical protein AAFX59_00535 [Pseudomonadota bacterium]
MTAGQLAHPRVAPGESGGAPGPVVAATVVAGAAVIVVHLQVEVLIDLTVTVVVDAVARLDPTQGHQAGVFAAIAQVAVDVVAERITRSEKAPGCAAPSGGEGVAAAVFAGPTCVGRQQIRFTPIVVFSVAILPVGGALPDHALAAFAGRRARSDVPADVVAGAAVVQIVGQVEPLVDLTIAVVVDLIADLDGDPIAVDVGQLAEVLAPRVVVVVVVVLLTRLEGAVSIHAQVDRVGDRARPAAIAAVERIALKIEALIDLAIAVVIDLIADLDGDPIAVDVGQLAEVLTSWLTGVEVVKVRLAPYELTADLTTHHDAVGQPTRVAAPQAVVDARPRVHLAAVDRNLVAVAPVPHAVVQRTQACVAGDHRVLCVALEPILSAVEATLAAALDVPVHERVAPDVPVALTETLLTAGQFAGSLVALGEPGGASRPIGAAIVAAGTAVGVVHQKVEVLVDLAVAVVVHLVANLDGDPVLIDVGQLTEVFASRVAVVVVIVVLAHLKGAVALDTQVDRVGDRAGSAASAAVEQVGLEIEVLVDLAVAVVVHLVADLDGNPVLIDVG